MATKQKGYLFAWTRAGKIYAQKNESSPLIRLSKLSDITKIINCVAPVSQEFANFSSFRDDLENSNLGRDLTIVIINIRSLRKYWDEFKSITEAATGYVEVFVITKINIPEYSIHLFSLPN